MQINLSFQQDVAEAYRISVCDVQLYYTTQRQLPIDKLPRVILRDIKHILLSPCAIIDNTGVIPQHSVEGEQIVIFLEKVWGQKKGAEITELQAYAPKKTVFRIGLNFLKKDFTHKNLILFPITRKITNYFLHCALRRRIVEVELEFRQPDYRSVFSRQTDAPGFCSYNSFVYGMQVTNISFKIIKNVEWARYIDARLRVCNEIDDMVETYNKLKKKQDKRDKRQIKKENKKRKKLAKQKGKSNKL